MNKNSCYEDWKAKNIKIIEEMKRALHENEHFVLNLMEKIYFDGYYDGLNTQETKTAEYHWNNWNQK